MSLKMPQAWTKIEATVKKEITARIDMSDGVAGQGLCPECQTPMETVFLGDGQEVLSCIKDRIVLPKKDLPEAGIISE